MALFSKAKPVDQVVKQRIDRATKELESVLGRRREAEEFAANNHYVSVGKDKVRLTKLNNVAVSEGGDRPDHRVRISRDVLAPILKGKVSAATQRIPGYEVGQPTKDWEDFSAAQLSKKIAFGGYEKWEFKEAFRRACWLAFVTEEAFLMPQWDADIGPFIEIPGEKPGEVADYLGMGDVRLEVFGGTEVSWESGVQFKDARYYIVRRARPVERVQSEEGYEGGKLKADAVGAEAKQTENSDLCMVTEYLERPCREWPDGRRLIYANDKCLFPEEDYPLRDEKNEVVDAPCLHRLYYSVTGSPRARGLVQSLIETVRQYDHMGNKAMEFIALTLVPQMMAPEGAILNEDIDDNPGAVLEYDPSALVGGAEIKWRDMPSMPREFEAERKLALEQLGFIANDNLIHATTESGKQVEALVQKDILAWQDFIEQLAEVHASVMRDALVLVQLYYTEQRMIAFRGRTGWEDIEEFRGADIRGQTDVRIQPGSLEPLTRGVVEQRIMNINSMFPGFFSPEVLIAALTEGNVDRLTEQFEAAEEQAHFIIGQIRAGTFWELPPRRVLPGEEVPRLNLETGEPELDPETGQMALEQTIPGWMPRPFENVSVIRRRIESFMQSDEGRHLDAEAQEATGLVYDALLKLEAQRQAKEAAQQSQTAEELGQANAAKPQPPKALPSLPAGGGEASA